MASQNRLFDVVEMVLLHNANVNDSDNDEWTPLCMAAYKGKDRVAQLLQRAGADPIWTVTKGWNGINAGSTPQQIASQNGYGEICTILLDKDPSVDHPDNDGRTDRRLCAWQYTRAVVVWSRSR